MLKTMSQEIPKLENKAEEPQYDHFVSKSGKEYRARILEDGLIEFQNGTRPVKLTPEEWGRTRERKGLELKSDKELEKIEEKKPINMETVQRGDILEMSDGSFLHIIGWDDKTGKMKYRKIEKDMRTDKEGMFKVLPKEQWLGLQNEVKEYLPVGYQTKGKRKPKQEQPKKTDQIDKQKLVGESKTPEGYEEMLADLEKQEPPIQEKQPAQTKETKTKKPKTSSLEKSREILDELDRPILPKIGQVITSRGGISRRVFAIDQDKKLISFEQIDTGDKTQMTFTDYEKSKENIHNIQGRKEFDEKYNEAKEKLNKTESLNLKAGQTIFTPSGEAVKVIEMVREPKTEDAALKDGYAVLEFQPKQNEDKTWRNKEVKREVVPFHKLLWAAEQGNLNLKKPAEKTKPKKEYTVDEMIEAFPTTPETKHVTKENIKQQLRQAYWKQAKEKELDRRKNEEEQYGQFLGLKPEKKTEVQPSPLPTEIKNTGRWKKFWGKIENRLRRLGQ